MIEKSYAIAVLLWGLVVAYAISIVFEVAVPNPIRDPGASLLLLLISVYAAIGIIALDHVLKWKEEPLKTYSKNFLIGFMWLVVGLISERVINLCKNKSKSIYLLSMIGLWIFSSILYTFIIAFVLVFT